MNAAEKRSPRHRDGTHARRELFALTDTKRPADPSSPSRAAGSTQHSEQSISPQDAAAAASRQGDSATRAARQSVAARGAEQNAQGARSSRSARTSGSQGAARAGGSQAQGSAAAQQHPSARRPSVHEAETAHPANSDGAGAYRSEKQETKAEAKAEKKAAKAEAKAEKKAHHGDGHGRGRGEQPHKQSKLTRLINDWINRLLGATKEHDFAGQEAEYSSGRTTRDFVCNIVGTVSFGMLFPVLTIVVTQLVGVEQAGMFSLAYVAGSLLLIIANFGMRPYQVSDINEEHSFADYQIHRLLCCLIMIVAGWLYCLFRGYSGAMLSISMGIYAFKMIEGLADVYEGRLQQMDKMYLAGISQAIRSLFVLIMFSLILLITRNLAASCIAMPILALITFFLVTFPLAKFETEKSVPFVFANVIDLFKQCFPLFISLFLYTFIDYMPVFVMESVLSYDNQLYYNAMYFPAQAIALGMSVVYKPLLLRIANIWADRKARRRFDLITIGMVALIALVTAIAVGLMAWIGVPLWSFLYGLDFEPYRQLMYIFLIAGGVTSVIDFLYQIITVLRHQQNIIQCYLITFCFSLFVPALLVNFTGLPGAVIGYLIVMCILCVLTFSEYLRVRIAMAKEEKAEDEAEAAAAPAEPHPLPSEVRAERERREAVHAKWEGQAAEHEAEREAQEAANPRSPTTRKLGAAGRSGGNGSSKGNGAGGTGGKSAQ